MKKYEEVMGKMTEALNESLYEFIDCDGDMSCSEFESLYELMMEVRKKRREYFESENA